MAESARTCPYPAFGAAVAPVGGTAAPDDSLGAVVEGLLAEFFADRRAATGESDTGFDTETVQRLQDFVLSGGKRIRPAFAWWGWRAAGGAAEGPAARSALRAASALELLHACALIQDDVMDASTLRRGRPAVHIAVEDEHRRRRWAGGARRYGESVAVLAGDLALAWADDMLDEALDGLGTRRLARVPWQRMRTELITGQFLDLRARASGDDSPDAALRVDRLKTAAYSAERPLHLGAAMAGGDDVLTAALRGYGAEVGTAFQLRDDLLGLYGDPAVTGKPVGDDIREGKPTLLWALGVERARARGDAESAAVLRACAGDTALGDDAVATLAALLEELGARAAVEERISRLVESGLDRIRDTPMPGAARRALESMAVQAATRTR
ncbi:polyprenyl synthetase family protein [Streptomonospora sp. PA3]|uniref:polyprenyl synthetase family protein n=1 Tax=Streptomonospora sp. PA3 TaxID=2607326 RepID=UPI001643524D|nr:polyprenyl synthetase family protein [Streptomonospora sp. PA3]